MVGDKLLRRLANLSKLESLSIGIRGRNMNAVELLADLPSLKTLQVVDVSSDNDIGPSGNLRNALVERIRRLLVRMWSCT